MAVVERVPGHAGAAGLETTGRLVVA